MNEFWGKQRGNMMPKMCEREKMECPKQCEREKPMEFPKQCECEKHNQRPCNPPRICEDRPCEFCGFVWRKCPCCGKCCCCKVWRCGEDFIFVCGECGEVFRTWCEEDCNKK